MKRLQCEICGSNDLIKEEGVFVCQACGCKYSVEEVRKLMIEGTVDVSGSTVKVDNTGMIQNYLNMAQNAYEAKNIKEAELYANKVIEIDQTNCQAWLIKGKAAGWQSTLANNRIAESVFAFGKAIEYACEDERELVTNKAKTEITNLAMATVLLRCNHFRDCPNEDNANSLCNDIILITDNLADIAHAGVEIEVDEFMNPLAFLVCKSIQDLWTNKIAKEYIGDMKDSNDKPNKYRWQQFVSQTDNCIKIVRFMITTACNDYEKNIGRYQLLIMLQQAIIESGSWNYRFTDFGKNWYVDWTLSDEAKTVRNNIIVTYQQSIKDLEKKSAKQKAEEKAAREKKEREEREQRVKEYWECHPEERKNFEELRKSVCERIEELRTERQAVGGLAEIKELEKNVSALKSEKDSLGAFKIKEKKGIQEQIDAVEAELKTVKNKRNSEIAEIDKKIKAFNDRLKEIDHDLTKDRR